MYSFPPHIILGRSTSMLAGNLKKALLASHLCPMDNLWLQMQKMPLSLRKEATIKKKPLFCVRPHLFHKPCNTAFLWLIFTVKILWWTSQFPSLHPTTLRRDGNTSVHKPQIQSQSMKILNYIRQLPRYQRFFPFLLASRKRPKWIKRVTNNIAKIATL